MSPRTFLLTGGTGQTAGALAQHLLSRTDAHLILTSRKGAEGIPPAFASSSHSERVQAVQFDWDDPSSYATPFDLPEKKIDVVYLVPHHSSQSLERTKAFIDRAVEHGVSRIIMLSASATPIDGPGPGKLHRLLEDARESGKLKEYGVLRPSWFFTNFANQYAPEIRDANQIISAAGDGKYGWVSVEDIAEAAFCAIVDPSEELYGEYLITGPELLNLDEVAVLLSEALSRQITHVRLSEAESLERWTKMGVSPQHAQTMTQLDIAISNGLEERVFELKDEEPRKLKRWVGKKKMKDFVQANKSTWLK
ncbi:hypothetical protein V5O48_001475 [Marasmius crinis-equi]|uniref:NAD(P)-binding domain-containing protein n=1 Tax=Marasmius crinis-equi TaxID=585013 RepID=A0ABR3FYZ2_9AGAR